MHTNENTTVAEIAAGSLVAVRVFERLGIDYCCGGKRPLADVCRQKGYDAEAVRRELDEAAKENADGTRDWNTAPLEELIDHIVNIHHAYLRRELPALSARLETHMQKEEMLLFPAIASHRPFDALANAVGIMEAEHESAGRALVKIREITHDFQIPAYACVTYRALINGLQELEEDLHIHIHLENNVLFPRAMQRDVS